MLENFQKEDENILGQLCFLHPLKNIFQNHMWSDLQKILHILENLKCKVPILPTKMELYMFFFVLPESW